MNGQLVEIAPIIEVTGAADSRGIDHELARIVASATFRSAPRLAAFLRFVVEKALAGQTDRIKGYTIGVEALGRAESFDPRTDAIVRVEAGRLRRALTRFYAGEGADDPVVIELPLGRYVPNFREGRTSPTSVTSEAEAIILTLERLIEVHRLQAEAIAAQVAAARRTLKAAALLDATATAGPGRDPPVSETQPRSRCRRCPDRRI